MQGLQHIVFQFEIDDLPTNTLKELIFKEVKKFKDTGKKCETAF